MRLLFLDPIDWDYTVETVYQQPLGGSQSALCYLAEALARRGHQVTLLSHTRHPGLYRGVSCLALPTLTAEVVRSLAPDVCIVLNMPLAPQSLRELLGSRPLLVFWTQHATDQPQVRELASPAVAEGYDGVVFVSHWQSAQYLGAFRLRPEQTVVLRNAIAPAFENLFPAGASVRAAKTRPPVLAYTSTPFRGLEVLLSVFPEIRQAVPGTRLRVWSSMQVYRMSAHVEAARFGGLYQACRQMEGVEYRGSIPQPELARELREVSLLAYPNTFAETFCIAALEALAAGCGMVSSQLGALGETTAGLAELVSLADGRDAYRQRFLEAVVAQLQAFLADDNGALEDRLRSQVELINTQSTWARRAAEWETWLQDRLGRAGRSQPHSGPVPPQGPDAGTEAAATAALLAQAVAFHGAGQWPQAERIYRQILQTTPQHAEAWQLLGVLAYQTGNHAVAIESCQRALALNPHVPFYHCNLAQVYHATQQLDQARACYQQALQLDPNFAGAHNNLGVVLLEQGRLTSAVASFRRAVELQPDYADAHRNLGTALQALGQLEAATDCLRRVLQLQPHDPQTCNELGILLGRQGRLAEAEGQLRRALQLRPDFPEAANNLGNALKAQGKLDDALACYRQALQLQPDYAEAHNNLGTVWQQRKRAEEAAACYRRALELRPNYAEAHNNLGTVQTRLDDAIACYQRALASQPDYAEAHNNLATAMLAQGKLEEAVAGCRRALELQPNFAAAHSNLLLTLQHRDDLTLAELAAAHNEFDQRHATLWRNCWTAHDNPRDPERPLRLGFISPDFGRHPSGYFTIQPWEQLAVQGAELIAYSDRFLHDELTARFQAAASTWREVAGWTDHRLAEQIRADRIDILFDMAGHTAGNRLLVFARKPAPLQISWLGYAGSTGLAAMDWMLIDRFQVPEGAERYYRERILRMPHSYVAYEAPAEAPPVSASPAVASGRVTFGCFNRPSKITARIIAAWAAILQRVPQSRLVLKYHWISADSSWARWFTEVLASHGVEPGRVEFCGQSPHAELLAEYARIDVALDPFPYNGCVTTCEALWMGVPVITCPGETIAARHSLSHLSNAGLTETIAGDLQEYVELAVAWATDLPRLAEWRHRLRGQMARSPLCAGAQFATDLLVRLRAVWREWAAGPAADAGS